MKRAPKKRGPRHKTPASGSAFNAEVADNIVKLLRQGNYLETAGAACGVQPHTVREWLRAGARGDPVFEEFSTRVNAAMASSETSAVGIIRRAGREDWRALSWLLERTQPKKFAQPLRVFEEQAATEQVDKFTKAFERGELTQEEYERALRVLSGGEGRSGAAGDPPGGEGEGAGGDGEAGPA